MTSGQLRRRTITDDRGQIQRRRHAAVVARDAPAQQSHEALLLGGRQRNHDVRDDGRLRHAKVFSIVESRDERVVDARQNLLELEEAPLHRLLLRRASRRTKSGRSATLRWRSGLLRRQRRRRPLNQRAIVGLSVGVGVGSIVIVGGAVVVVGGDVVGATAGCLPFLPAVVAV